MQSKSEPFAKGEFVNVIKRWGGSEEGKRNIGKKARIVTGPDDVGDCKLQFVDDGVLTYEINQKVLEHLSGEELAAATKAFSDRVYLALEDYVRVVEKVDNVESGRRGRIVYFTTVGEGPYCLLQFVDDGVKSWINKTKLERLSGEDLTSAAKEYEAGLQEERERAAMQSKSKPFARGEFVNIIACWGGNAQARRNGKKAKVFLDRGDECRLQFMDDGGLADVTNLNLNRLSGQELASAMKQYEALKSAQNHAKTVYKVHIIARFFILGGLIFCPMEFCLHQMVNHHPEIANKHNVEDPTGHTDFYPVPGCKLPPSQPLGIQATANSVKLVGGILILGTMPQHHPHDPVWKDNVEWWKRALYLAMTIYQIVLVPATVALTLRHFFMDAGPFESHWESYNCYAAMIVSGPWWFNLLMFLTKAIMSSGVLGSCGFDENGYSCGVSRFLIQSALLCPASDLFDRNCLPVGFKETFTGDRTVSHMEAQKSISYMILFYLTVFPYVFMMLPVIITHLIPAIVIFIPEVVVLAVMVAPVVWFATVNEKGTHISHALFSTTRETKDGLLRGEAWASAEASGGLMVLPILIAVNILVLVLVYQAIYFYHGDGWVNSVLETFTERQSTIYFTNFRLKVLNSWWTFTDVLNEST